MTTTARDAYLTTQVMTATPQKLQLLLIDAAIRSIQMGKKRWEEANEDAAGDALTHAQEVMGELLASVGSTRSQISRRLAGIYLFLFRTLTEAHLQHDEEKLDDCLRVLLIERETWSQVCEKFGSTREADQTTNAEELKAAPPATSHTQEQTGKPVSSEPAVPTGFDSSQMTAPRRSMPISFPAADNSSAASGISFEA